MYSLKKQFLADETSALMQVLLPAHTSSVLLSPLPLILLRGMGENIEKGQVRGVPQGKKPALGRIASSIPH